MNPLEELASRLRSVIAAPPGGTDVVDAVRRSIARVPPPRPDGRGGRRVHVLVTATQNGVQTKVFGPASQRYRAGLEAAVRDPQIRAAAAEAGRRRLGP